MYSESVGDMPSWYAIHTNAKQEDRAASNLQAWNVETFAPKVRDRDHNKATSANSYTAKHLFPRYIFARFDASRMLHKITYTRGVQSVVGFGSGPLAIEDEVIAVIKSQIREDGFVKIGDDLQYGDKVVIKDGPLKSLTGVFEREMKASERVNILLMTVSYNGHVWVQKNLVQKIS